MVFSDQLYMPITNSLWYPLVSCVWQLQTAYGLPLYQLYALITV